MRPSRLMKSLALRLALAAIVSGSKYLNAQPTLPPNSANAVGNAGVTFVLTPTADPAVFTITADGVVHHSLLGNASEHAVLQVTFPTAAGQPVTLNGSATLTSSGGANSLTFSVTGTAVADPANPTFFNNSYRVTFTGGTGAFAGARGTGSIDEVIKFSSAAAGTGTWTMKGYVVTPPSGS